MTKLKTFPPLSVAEKAKSDAQKFTRMHEIECLTLKMSKGRNPNPSFHVSPYNVETKPMPLVFLL